MPIDVNRLRAECLYEAQAPLGTVNADLTDIERIAADWRAARKRLQITALILLLVSLALLAVFPPAGLCLIVVAIALFFFVKKYSKAVARGVTRCSVARQVAGMLMRDTSAGEKVTIRLAFDPKQEVLSEVPLPNRRNGKQRLYKVSWFSLEACLLDGTTFSETIDDVVRERSFKNPRGKSKTKTRTRSVVSARFAYPAHLYGNAARLARRLQKEIQLPASAALKGFAADNRQVKAKVLVTKGEDLGETTPMLALGIYRMLNLSRKLAARAQRAQKGGQ